MTIAEGFSLLVLVASLAIYGVVMRGWQSLRQLRDVAPLLPSDVPRVSIIVAARNEAAAIEPAIRSILALDYPALEVVVVNDRSTDGTGEILERVRADLPALRVIHVRELPPRWLGKNHALWQGGLEARGDYLIFTDADVVYERSAIKRAVAHFEAERLDHLTLVPDVTARTGFLAFSVMGGFAGLLALERPWRARQTGKMRLGVGAFNMVRASAYRAAGGHEALAMEVLDDIELGRMMAERAGRQEFMLAHGLVKLEMYRTAGEFLRGIQKNVFTFLEYSGWMLVAASFTTFASSVWPWLGPLVTEGLARWICVAAAAAAVAFYAWLAPRFGYSRWCVIHLPYMGILTIALFWQIAIRTWLEGGVKWRGTFYPLADIRAGRRRWRASS